MELTGNCLKAFWLWYLLPKQLKTYKNESLMKYSTNNGANIRINFLADSFSQRWGVYEEFFATHDIYFQMWHEFYDDGVNHLWQIVIYDPTDKYNTGDQSTAQYGDNGEYPTIWQARMAAIAKANHIYNNPRKTGA